MCIFLVPPDLLSDLFEPCSVPQKASLYRLYQLGSPALHVQLGSDDGDWLGGEEWTWAPSLLSCTLVTLSSPQSPVPGCMLTEAYKQEGMVCTESILFNYRYMCAWQRCWCLKKR